MHELITFPAPAKAIPLSPADALRAEHLKVASLEFCDLYKEWETLLGMFGTLSENQRKCFLHAISKSYLIGYEDGQNRKGIV